MTELVWHGHHEAEFPVEVLRESYESRLNTIMTVKAKDEAAWQIERRLHLFKKVQNPPEWLIKAWAEYDKARDEYYKASAEYRKPWAKYSKIIQLNLKELMELHKTECGCGWTQEGPNIFNYSDTPDVRMEVSQ